MNEDMKSNVVVHAGQCTGDFASNMTALAREAKKQIMQENVRGVGEDGTLTPAPGASRRF